MMPMVEVTTSLQECIMNYLVKDPTMSDGQIAKLCGTSHQYVNKLRKKLAAKMESSQSEEGRDGGEKGRKYVGTGISEVMKALGKEYAETIEKLGEKRTWFTSVLVDLGFESILMAFQYARIDPKDIPRKIEEFDDPEKFKEFVRKYLAAMIESSTDATNAILERDKRIKQLETALKVITTLFGGLKRRVEELALKMNIAEMLISKYGLQEEYIQMLMQADIINALTRIPVETKQEQFPTEQKKEERMVM
jgi:hypothetical protein